MKITKYQLEQIIENKVIRILQEIIMTPDDIGTIKFFKKYSKFLNTSDDSYFYHTTFFNKFSSIFKAGLLPKNGVNFGGYSTGKQVSLSPSHKDNEYWSSMLFWNYWNYFKKLSDLLYL